MMEDQRDPPRLTWQEDQRRKWAFELFKEAWKAVHANDDMVMDVAGCSKACVEAADTLMDALEP